MLYYKIVRKVSQGTLIRNTNKGIVFKEKYNTHYGNDKLTFETLECLSNVVYNLIKNNQTFTYIPPNSIIRGNITSDPEQMPKNIKFWCIEDTTKNDILAIKPYYKLKNNRHYLNYLPCIEFDDYYVSSDSISFESDHFLKFVVAKL